MARLVCVHVPPLLVQHKIVSSLDISPGLVGGDWDEKRCIRLEETDKYKSVFQRYRDGMRWEDTSLFTNIYNRRFGLGGDVRGFRRMKDLVAFYYSQYDPMFEHMKAHGFVLRTDDGTPTSVPHVFVCRDGTMALGNNGNHRVPMAHLLGLDSMVVEIRTVHADAPDNDFVEVPMMDGSVLPELHEGALDTPAMTSLDERKTYYRHARRMASSGQIVELGTWLGAATIFMAAGVRDSGVDGVKVHAFDKFKWNQKMHGMKAGGSLDRPMKDQVEKNLGPLLPLVSITQCEITQQEWNGGTIGALFLDAPKHLRVLQYVLAEFGAALAVGGVLSIQDFAYFPAYDLVPAMTVLMDMGKVSFIEAAAPTTVVFEKTAEWTKEEMMDINLSSKGWPSERIQDVWDVWAPRIPDKRFPVGACWLLYDRGEIGHALAELEKIKDIKEVRDKFTYLKSFRPGLVNQYARLFELMR